MIIELFGRAAVYADILSSPPLWRFKLCFDLPWLHSIFYPGRMNAASRDSFEGVSRRVDELESLFTHMQRTMQDLNDVLLAQQSRLEALEAQITRHARDAEALATVLDERRTLEDDKPPHY